jgi:hypothetical protein
MTVADLFAELQRLPPQKRVCVVLSHVTIADESGEGTIYLADQDALDADDVRDEGAFVLIRSR